MRVLSALQVTPFAAGIVAASLLAIMGSSTAVVSAAESGGGTPPVNAGLPAISGAVYGDVLPGDTLSCSTGSWTGTPSPSFSYQWLRNGSIIAGATEPTYVAPVTEERTTLVCEVTASNDAGKQTARSTGVSILFTQCCDRPVMGPTSAQLAARLAVQLTPFGKAATITSLLKNGGFTFCLDELARGTAEISWYQPPRGAQLDREARAKRVRVAVGHLARSGRWLGSLWTARMVIKLTAEGRRVLAHARRIKLTAKGTFRPPFGPPVRATKIFVLKR
jgi:hypothetical protein